MEIVAGTYEELLLGYKLIKGDNGYELEQSFTDHSHTGCIKCVAISQQNILVSGSTDETIHIFNLRSRKEMGTLQKHSGTLTSLEFFQKSHLFSTSEDGKLCVWKVANWEALRTFKGHKGAVNCVSVHPSGKMALTVGQDRSLHTWNLVTGRRAFTSNIKLVAEIVQFSPDGNFYVLCSNNNIHVYSVTDGQIHSSIVAAKRVNNMVFVTENILAYGGEGGDIFFHDVVNGKQLHELATECNRIRGLSVCLSHEDPQSGDRWLTLSSSDGFIRVYLVQIQQDKVSTKLLVSHNTSFRLTCLATSRPPDSHSVQVASVKTPQPKVKNTSEHENVISREVSQSESAVAPKELSDAESKSDSDAEIFRQRAVNAFKRKAEAASLHKKGASNLKKKKTLIEPQQTSVKKMKGNLKSNKTGLAEKSTSKARKSPVNKITKKDQSQQKTKKHKLKK